MGFETISAADMLNYVGKANTLIIDIRMEEEYTKEHITSAINIPFRETEDVKEKFFYLTKQYSYIIFYCQRGNLSMLVARELGETNAKIYTLYGGINGFKRKLSIDGMAEIRHNDIQY